MTSEWLMCHKTQTNHVPISIFADWSFSLPTGVQAYAEAILIIVKVLAQNSGLDPQETMVKLLQEYTSPSQAVGIDIKTGKSLQATVILYLEKFKNA